MCFFFFCKQKTAYEMRISDWSSDVCSSDLVGAALQAVSRNHPETRGNPPFCGTMSRGNERDLAQSLKKRCADKYIAMSRDIAFILLSPATSRKPSNLPNPTLNPSEPRQKMRATLDRAPLPETRSEEHTSELQSLMRNSYAVFCLKKKKK